MECPTWCPFSRTSNMFSTGPRADEKWLSHIGDGGQHPCDSGYPCRMEDPRRQRRKSRFCDTPRALADAMKGNRGVQMQNVENTATEEWGQKEQQMSRKDPNIIASILETGV